MAAPRSKHTRTRDTRKARAALRVKSGRVAEALRSTREHEAELEARIAREQAEAELIAAKTEVARATRDVRHVADIAPETKARLKQAVDTFLREQHREERRKVWNLGQARHMYRQGYTLEHCVEATGWDAHWFEGALEVQAILDGDA